MPDIARQNTNSSRERRKYPRIDVLKPVKLRCTVTGKYLSGQTRNLSSGGAMIDVEHPQRLTAGQKVQLGIAWSSRQSVLHTRQLVEATVIRSGMMNQIQTLAVQFTQPQTLALSA